MASRPRIFSRGFLVVLTLVSAGAYIAGKDVALRDNARDEIRRESQR